MLGYVAIVLVQVVMADLHWALPKWRALQHWALNSISMFVLAIFLLDNAMRSIRNLSLIAACLAVSGNSPRAVAWNPLGHAVVGEIAWQELDPNQRVKITDILKRHPRFGEDFVKLLPAELSDRWIFWQAGNWPDVVREIPEDVRPLYNRPTWHYVNFPFFVGPERPVEFNRAKLPTPPEDNWNIYQAMKHNLDVLRSDAPPQEKAVAYCWLLHLVGDMHQPLHSLALVSDRFPAGDNGGNLILVVNEKENLHWLWDSLLGELQTQNDVLSTYQRLKADAKLWDVDTSGTYVDWIAESRKIAESFVYSPEILEAQQQPGEMPPVQLSKEYLREAGAIARARVVAAGLRLATLLKSL